ncbi:MAG TPA: DNA primase [Baekduia sp.]|uniref:DNA primase n=1 Tax=Baekduia sp. TaxID=2600305 RepID=UPI002BD270D5|nr:DNA primase [Baekduia sp.]HMJ33778.1 DNA primase [Baekduia sp.]
MPRYADDSKEKVREAVDMVDLVSTRTELRRAGPGRFKGLCPFHEERTPSFSVNADDGFYHCFGCGVGGDAFRFVMETEGLDFVGALESLAQRYGVEIAVEDEDPAAAERRRQRDRLLALLERAASFYEKWLWDSAEAAPARLYLAERGLSDETLRTFRVGYAPSAWDKLLTAGRQGGYGNKELFDAGLAVRAKGEGRIYDRFRRRIMFPLSDARGRILGFGARALGTDQQPKYLNSADGEVFTKGDMVFGAHLARGASARADEVIVAEGYTDVLALHQAGMQNVVGIMGTALTEKQVGELAKLGKTILLALDADSAGQEAMLRAARLAAGRQLQLRVVPLPKGLDPADLVQQQGADAARALVESSVPFVRFQIERELERGDLTQAEGKDAVIAALKPAFATLPPSALREELLAHVADRVDLAPSLVSSWLPAPGSAGAPGHRGGGNGWGSGGPAPRREPEALPVSSDPAVRAERALLAYCVGMKDDGRDTLSRLPDEAFTDDLNRRAASYLREHWEAPVHGLAEGDDEPLRRLIVGLVAAADQSDLSRAVLQSQLARVELAHINRQISAAKVARSGGITELVARRANVEQRLHQHLGERMEEGRPTD